MTLKLNCDPKLSKTGQGLLPVAKLLDESGKNFDVTAYRWESWRRATRPSVLLSDEEYKQRSMRL